MSGVSLPWLFLKFLIIIPPGALVMPDGVKLFIFFLDLVVLTFPSGIRVKTIGVVVIPDGVIFTLDGVKLLNPRVSVPL